MPSRTVSPTKAGGGPERSLAPAQLIAYAEFLVGGIFLPQDAAPWLFAIGVASLILLFVGIHNAWDAVTYIALVRRRRKPEEGKRPCCPAPHT